MIDVAHLIKAYDRNVRILKMQTEGLSHDESLIQLPFRANCLNWIVGHLVTNRNNVLKLMGAEDQISPVSVQRYMRDTDPVTPDSEDILPLENLLQLLEESQEKIKALLLEATNEDFAPRIAFFGNTEMSIGEWLLFFYFHDTYHTGQAEILRQAAGTDDKII
jgi:uncharacterized damage-inducible protein DinB